MDDDFWRMWDKATVENAEACERLEKIEIRIELAITMCELILSSEATLEKKKLAQSVISALRE